MSDDFLFDDDIVFDEAALAILDAEESKYLSSLANVESNPRPAPTQPAPPPAKRQRTDGDGGWKHPPTGIGNGSGKLAKRSDSFYEDLPDISLAGDGVYGVYSQGSQPPQSSNLAFSVGVKNVQNPLGQRSLPTPLQQPAPTSVPPPRERILNTNQNRPPPPQRTYTPPSNLLHNPNNSSRPQPQPQARQQQPLHPQHQNPNQTRVPVPRTGSVPPQPNRPQNLGLGRNVNVPRQQPRQQQARHVTSVPPHPAQSRPSDPINGGVPDKDLQDEIARLRTQLEQVRGHDTAISDPHN
jgi:hypothetical protein